MAKNDNSNRRLTFDERFLKALEYHCDGEDIAISSKILREYLGWRDERFDQTRNGLIQKGVIKPAPGPGGRTKFVTPYNSKSKKKALRAFVSYAHADEEFKNKLLQHLKPLEQLGLIENWHDRKIKAGENISDIITTELEKADLIFILVSIDFINSVYCYEIELGRALEMDKEGTTRIIPIIIRDCLWQHTEFSKFLALPTDGKAITSWGNVDNAFTTVARAIHDLSKEMLKHQD